MPEARMLDERDAWGNPVSPSKTRNVSSSRAAQPTPADFEIRKEKQSETDSLGLPLKQFTPVRRSPFVPRSSTAEPATKKQRTLSQTPPANLPDLGRFQYFPRGQQEATDKDNIPTMPVLAMSASPAPTVQKHTVRRGETLESIALQTYGSRNHAQKIYEANRDRLRSPNGLREGTTLLLP
jgi:nucleoid-associated protein YgaU